MLSKIRAYFNKDKNLINIFLVYLFLAVVIGYLDFDKRVMSFDQSTECLKQVVRGEAKVPMVRRILIPYIVHFIHQISHLPLNYTFAAFRLLLFFLSFVLFHIYLKKWFDDKLAMIGTLSLIASLPVILTNWYCLPTDMPDLIAFILGTMWIRDNQYKNLFILIPIATLNRESAVALVLLYFLNGIGKEKRRVLIKKTMVLFFLWLIPFATLILIFDIFDIRSISNLLLNFRGRPDLFFNFRVNLKWLLEILKSPNPYNYYYFLLYLCGFYWILAFRNFRKKDALLKRSVIVMVLYFLYAFFIAAGIREVRIFLPFYVFVIPLGLFSLFREDSVKEEIKVEKR